MASNYNKVLFPNGRILVCPPPFFDVTYEINAWMDVNNPPNKDRSKLQWRELQHTILALGVHLEYLEPDGAVPDLVFTANAALIRDNIAVLSKFKYPERQKEEPINKAWLEQNGFKVHEVKTGFFEGEGDALFAGDILFMGSGFRTEEKVKDEIAQALNINKLIACDMVDPYYYHLDTCFAPLNENLALIHKSAFTEETFKVIDSELELIVVPDEEAKKFVCNAVVINQNVILPKDCPKTYKMLEDKGFKSYPVELTEFLKGGGSAKCLTLFLDRTSS